MITCEYICDEIEEILSKDKLNSCDLRVLHDLFSVKKYLKKYMQYECDFTYDVANNWVNKMVNSDGTIGQHWTIGETTDVKNKLGCKNISKNEFYAIMNSIYSDYGETLTKAGVTSADVYGELACDWLNDEDADEDKALNYYNYIVEHD